MAEKCDCIMMNEIKRIQEDILKNERDSKETEKVVYEIKESHSQTKFLMEQIQKNQEAQAIATEKRETATALANEKNRELVAQTNKENKETMAAGFKNIADKKLEEEKSVAEERKAAEKEKLRLKELQDTKDESLRKERRAQTWGVWLIGIGIAASTLFGLLKVYVPKMIGL